MRIDQCKQVAAREATPPSRVRVRVIHLSLSLLRYGGRLLLLNLFFFSPQVCEAVAASANLVLRYRGKMLHCDDCVRITVGLRPENDEMLRALEDALRIVNGAQ